MNIFLDDIRDAPNKNWMVIRNPKELIKFLEEEKVNKLSLDHDLGKDVMTGYDVICWLEKNVIERGLKAPKLLITHTANPVGKMNIKRAIYSIKKWERENGKN